MVLALKNLNDFGPNVPRSRLIFQRIIVGLRRGVPSFVHAFELAFVCGLIEGHSLSRDRIAQYVPIRSQPYRHAGLK